MRFVCVFEAVYVCVCAGQSKTGSIVKAFETLLTYRQKLRENERERDREREREIERQRDRETDNDRKRA